MLLGSQASTKEEVWCQTSFWGKVEKKNEDGFHVMDCNDEQQLTGHTISNWSFNDNERNLAGLG